MKLKPYIIPFIKDAAKSVKRIRQEDFKEVVDETLTELLGILNWWCVCTHCGVRANMRFCTCGALIVKRLPCALIAAAFPQ
jgi:hypothetical protein